VFLLALLYAAVIGFAVGLIFAIAVGAFVLALTLAALLLLLWVALLAWLAALVALLLPALVALLLAALRLILPAMLARAGARIFVTGLRALAALLAGSLFGWGHAAALVILIGLVALVGILLAGIFLLNFRCLTASRIIRIAVLALLLGCFSSHGVSPFVF
jgi:hypothetical protein